MKKSKLLEAVEPGVMLEEAGITFRETGNFLLFKCPFHTPDNNPSCLFNLETKYYECKSCGTKGDAIDFYSRLLKTDRVVSAKFLGERFAVHLDLTINPVKIEEWKNSLRKSTRFKMLLKRKGIEAERAINEFDIGLNKQWITIPHKNDRGEYVGCKLYNPVKKPKYKTLKGFKATHIYPLGFVELPDSGRVFLTEGELKALLLRQYGLCAFSVPNGCSSWSEDWQAMFEGLDVYIVYDIDAAGRRGAVARAKDIYSVARSVHIVKLPISPKKIPNGDVTDYFVSLGHSLQDFEELVRSTPPWIPATVPDVGKDQEAIDVNLSRITHTDYYARRIRTRAVVSAKDTAPYFVPKEIKVRCDKDQKCCALCPIAASDTGEVKVGKLNPVVLEFVGARNAAIDMLLRKVTGIPKKCAACSIKVESTYSVEEVQLIPQINLTTSEEHCTIRAFTISHGIETNAGYQLEGCVYPYPRTQQAVLLSDKQVPSRDNLGEFELEDKARLLIFQPRDWDPEAIGEKLNEIYRDFEYNVTGIYERRNLHLLFDLVYHSPLWIRIDDSEIKGWAEGAIIGDSGQGKSTIGEKLISFYGLGERINCKNATVAGLLGGLNETSRRWFLTWGIIPLNDRRIVILDEVKGASCEVLGCLTDMRSSGMAEIVKIERRRASARTRLIWISNPRSGRQISTYNYGVEAIRELFGALEDVRRLDIAMAVGSGEVDQMMINRPKSRRDKVEHKYKGELCKQLVLWAWSRSIDEIVFDDDALEAVYDMSNKMSKKYHSGIPLVEPADQRNKLARLSAAIAARTFSFGDSLQQVLVRECHVKYVAQFMQRCYDDPLMGYDRFSNDRYSAETLKDANSIKTALLNVPYPKDLQSNMLSNNTFTLVDVQNWSGSERDSAQALISLLVRKNAIKHLRTYYVKTAQFTQWLRRTKLDVERPEL